MAACWLVRAWVPLVARSFTSGLQDEDKARLEEQLKAGGAAVVAMADDFEVEPTQAELSRLGGTVENFAVPEETSEQLEEAQPAEEQPAAPASE